MPGRKKRPRATPLFMLIAVILFLLIILLAISEANRRADEKKTMDTFNRLSAITPTPSATVPNVRITAGMDSLPTSTPVPVSREDVFLTAVPLTTAAPVTPAPTTEAEAVLSVGSGGEEVRRLQQRLKELGYYSGEVDGDFGSGTKNAVIWFQRQHGLSVDGIAGNATKTALYSASAQIAFATPTPEPIQVLDGEIPLLVNREHPVDKNFVPTGLVKLEDTIPKDLCIYKIKNLQAVDEAVQALIQMLQAAHADGLNEWQISEAYRTYDKQSSLFDNSVAEYMKEDGMSRSRAQKATRQTVADPGTSEHHTGLAFDITVPGKFFCDTQQYRWMLENCWDYGFILRYTDEKTSITGFLGEEWHFRYVGREHALRIRDANLCLEEYVDLLERQ